MKAKPDEKSKKLKYMEKVARHCGVLPVGKKYKTVFGDCYSDQDKIKKVKELLTEAGMTGELLYTTFIHYKIIIFIALVLNIINKMQYF